MTTITINTKDTSTLAVSKPATLPIVPADTKVRVSAGERSVTFISGWSSSYQLCPKKGTGLELHNFLMATPVNAAGFRELTVEIG